MDRKLRLSTFWTEDLLRAHLAECPMFTKNTTKPSTEILSDTSKVDELRAQRVGLQSNVALMTWFFFAIYSLIRGYTHGVSICIIECVILRLIIVFQGNSTNYRRMMNHVLGATALGLLATSICVPALRPTILFFPASIVIASQLLGIRAAFQWLVVSIIAYSFFFLASFTLDGVFGVNTLDEMMLVLGVAVCVFFCCQQGEEYYHERTKDLVELSHRLRKKADRLHTLATTDALTGLVNRFQFQIELSECVSFAVENNEKMSLLLIDMDGFKEINDTLGHPIGDQALIEVANRLRHEFRHEAIVARLGGDEFCLICSGIVSDENALDIGARACELLTRRYSIDEFEFPLGASVGLAICPDDTQSDTDLLTYADTAMFHAKENRLGFSRYQACMTERLVEARTMQEKLSQALELNEFFLLYQPQVNVATGKIIGVEALLRWYHEGQVISPVRFIPILEASREIVPVGRWIIEESCRQLREWNDAGFDIEVSINLSAVQFGDDDLIESISDALKKHDLNAEKLDFEITESLLVDDVQEAIERLTQIKSLGSSISIDDFGTGYSSLAYLQQFPLDRLKIDRAFVKDYPETDDGVIATSIVALAKALGLKALAEGVETDSQLQLMKSLDCDEFQGYLYSRPVKGEDIVDLLAEESADDSTSKVLSPTFNAGSSSKRLEMPVS